MAMARVDSAWELGEACAYYALGAWWRSNTQQPVDSVVRIMLHKTLWMRSCQLCGGAYLDVVGYNGMLPLVGVGAAQVSQGIGYRSWTALLQLSCWISRSWVSSWPPPHPLSAQTAHITIPSGTILYRWAVDSACGAAQLHFSPLWCLGLLTLSGINQHSNAQANRPPMDGTPECQSGGVHIVPRSGGTTVRSRYSIPLLIYTQGSADHESTNGAIFSCLLVAQGKRIHPSINRIVPSRGRRPAAGSGPAMRVFHDSQWSLDPPGSPPINCNPPRPLSCLSCPEGIKASEPDNVAAPHLQGCSSMSAAGLIRLLSVSRERLCYICTHS